MTATTQPRSVGPSSIPRTITAWAAPLVTAAAMIDAGVFANHDPHDHQGECHCEQFASKVRHL